MYRDKLLSLAQHAMRLHGTKLHIDAHADPTSPVSKEEDFFSQHTKDEGFGFDDIAADQKLSAPQPVKNGTLSSATQDPGVGPNVEPALSTSPTQAASQNEPRKTLIGAKKAPAGKKGKGLGAQRVKANFSEIENRAQQADKEREEFAKHQAVQEAKTQEEQEKQMASMRLAYQDMSIQRKKQEDKLKVSDPKKAEQLERLGMGFVSNKGISHSAVSDMQTIQQEAPSRGSRGADRDYDFYSSRSSNRGRDRDFFEDEMDSMTGFSSKRGGFGDSRGGSRVDDFGWGNPNKGGSWDIDTFESKSSSFSEPIAPKSEDRPSRSRKTATETSDRSSMSDTDRKKYANAKSISSDQFFGDRDPDFEIQQNLARMEGKSSISSDDVFGTGGSTSSRSYSGSSSTPDLQDIKDGPHDIVYN
nr:hypothetical protein BaRGS_018775 [Batillaria attramentaria]